jgi:hypothetical protein
MILSSEENSFRIYLTSEHERLIKLKAEAGSRYFARAQLLTWFGQNRCWEVG